MKYLLATVVLLSSILVPANVAAAANYTTSATSAPTTLTPGSNVTINALVRVDSNAQLLVDLEVYQPDGQRVFQQVWDNQSLTANQQRTFSATWSAPSNAATGAYTIKIGLFSPGWTTLHHWNNGAGQFTINGTTSSGRYFTTLPPGAKLPSDAECAAAIKRRPENKRVNAQFNATRGGQLPPDYASGPTVALAARVTGNFTGTTDEILQWAACKWGIDEDMVRAQAVAESWWRQASMGDWSSNPVACAPGHGFGVDGRPGQCPGSWGILQNRYEYQRGAWPWIKTSTAFNADVAMMTWRSCYEGHETWLNTVDRGRQYGAGDAWGCFGRWFSGRWYTGPAVDYINHVQGIVNQRTWELPYFQE